MLGEASNNASVRKKIVLSDETQTNGVSESPGQPDQHALVMQSVTVCPLQLVMESHTAMRRWI
jgi:hypothetical protein